MKIDNAKNPLTATFKGQGFVVHDETYTMGEHRLRRDERGGPRARRLSPRRSRLRVELDQARGQGRVFYESHSHSEPIYAMTPMLDHLRAGLQYALGDLKADDSPSRPE